MIAGFGGEIAGCLIEDHGLPKQVCGLLKVSLRLSQQAEIVSKGRLRRLISLLLSPLQRLLITLFGLMDLPGLMLRSA